MARLIWSPQAVSDLQNICAFIGQDSPEFARVMARRIVGLVETIRFLPRSGRVVPEYDSPNLRQRIVGNYRVIYRIAETTVEIVTIIHGARLLDDVNET